MDDEDIGAVLMREGLGDGSSDLFNVMDAHAIDAAVRGFGEEQSPANDQQRVSGDAPDVGSDAPSAGNTLDVGSLDALDAMSLEPAGRTSGGKLLSWRDTVDALDREGDNVVTLASGSGFAENVQAGGETSTAETQQTVSGKRGSAAERDGRTQQDKARRADAGAGSSSTLATSDSPSTLPFPVSRTPGSSPSLARKAASSASVSSSAPPTVQAASAEMEAAFDAPSASDAVGKVAGQETKQQTVQAGKQGTTQAGEQASSLTGTLKQKASELAQTAIRDTADKASELVKNSLDSASQAVRSSLSASKQTGNAIGGALSRSTAATVGKPFSNQVPAMGVADNAAELFRSTVGPAALDVKHAPGMEPWNEETARNVIMKITQRPVDEFAFAELDNNPAFEPLVPPAAEFGFLGTSAPVFFTQRSPPSENVQDKYCLRFEVAMENSRTTIYGGGD